MKRGTMRCFLGGLLAAVQVYPAWAVKSKGVITLSWHGQSCFHLTSPKGKRILMDPVPDSIGYSPVPMPADVVTISHEHFDHTNVGLARGEPVILRGLDEDLKGWQKHKRRFGDVLIRNVGVYHDEAQGEKRGLNSVFIFETAGLRLVHLGDLGHLLTAENLKAIGKCDVVMVPAGGFYTIDAQKAHEVISQLKPKYFVLPMHYKTDVLKIEELAAIEDFIKDRKNVEKVQGNTLKIDSSDFPRETKIILLDYK